MNLGCKLDQVTKNSKLASEGSSVCFKVMAHEMAELDVVSKRKWTRQNVVSFIQKCATPYSNVPHLMLLPIINQLYNIGIITWIYLQNEKPNIELEYGESNDEDLENPAIQILKNQKQYERKIDILHFHEHYEGLTRVEMASVVSSESTKRKGQDIPSDRPQKQQKSNSLPVTRALRPRKK